MNFSTNDFIKDEEQPVHKRVCLNRENECLTFRVSCKSTGIIGRLFDPQRLSQFIDYSLSNVFGWKVDLRNPQMEIYVHANEDYFTIGLPMVSRPLSERKYLKHIALRSTVCYAMLLCAGDLSVGSVLLDPMCGAGTLVTEAAVSFQNIIVIGADIDTVQLHKAKENKCSAITASSVIELVHADVTNLPLKNESVTSIVCDCHLAHKLTLLVRGGVQWRNKENHTVKLGGMFASICVFDKLSVCLILSAFELTVRMVKADGSKA
ncbi:THUMP domain-containing protein 2-like [Zootermopsis nevadensis]|uniref:THUMP domain-containing protein 2-like n=1 Tax=Zootermopsis nevadensis TaxID=136037 RepID=UPI000B8ED25A|nr:THUMP domain-containing protein 2-like [Zootermopsis nevadensis]